MLFELRCSTDDESEAGVASAGGLLQQQEEDLEGLGTALLYEGDPISWLKVERPGCQL